MNCRWLIVGPPFGGATRGGTIPGYCFRNCHTSFALPLHFLCTSFALVVISDGIPTSSICPVPSYNRVPAGPSWYI